MHTVQNTNISLMRLWLYAINFARARTWPRSNARGQARATVEYLVYEGYGVYTPVGRVDVLGDDKNGKVIYHF